MKWLARELRLIGRTQRTEGTERTECFVVVRCFAAVRAATLMLRPIFALRATKDEKGGIAKLALAGFGPGAMWGFRSGLKPEQRTQRGRKGVWGHLGGVCAK